MAIACYYHPEAKGSANCPQCQMPICDKCRLNGTAERCASCQNFLSKGGDKERARERVYCANHADIPTDQRCKSCRKPHCHACLNGAHMCFKCAMAGSDSSPSSGGSKGSASRGTGRLDRRGTGKLAAGARTGPLAMPARGKGKSGFDPKMLIGGLAVVLIGGYFASGALNHHAPVAKAYAGAADVAITSPRAGATLTGPQVIKLKVAAPDHIEKVEISIDGKYWDRFKEPPFESEWPTAIFGNGHHVVVAKVVYEGRKKTASDKQTFTTHNRR